MYSEKQYTGDPAFNNFVSSELNKFKETTQTGNELEDGFITLKELNKEIEKLKYRKAPGWDTITNEHVKHSGHLTKATLAWIMNRIVYEEQLPQTLKRGYIISLPKPNKDKSIKDNNRGITLLTVFYKLFEKILLNREKPWINSFNVMDELQGGGREQISCLHTSYLVQEAIAYNTVKGSNVFVAFLDIKKAFDSVWLPGFLYKLKMSGMRSKPWKLICDAYKSFQCAAYINGTPAPWFNVERGVHQGAPLSMPLYQVFINELIQNLKKSEYGCKIGDIDVTSPAHADDVTVIALYKKALNALLKNAYIYSIKWNFEFNCDKSTVLLWGKDNEPNVPIVIGPNTLKIENSCKHMGITLTTNKHMKKVAIEKRVSNGKKVLYAARGIGSLGVCVPPKALSKIYWSVAVSKMTYGLDVIPITAHELEEMNKAHRHMAKCIQMLPSCTPNPVPLASIGWLSISAYVAIIKLSFMMRVLNLPENNIYRRIMEFRLRDHMNNDDVPQAFNSPTYSMLKLANDYGFKDKIIIGLSGGEYGNINENKREIKKRIKERETNCWKATCLMYDRLKIYRVTIVSISMHAWYIFSNQYPQMCKKVSAVIAIACGTQPKGMYCTTTNTCVLCTRRAPDSPEHILFWCEVLSQIRDNHMQRIISEMPRALQLSFESMPPSEKVVFLISGFRCEYTREWSQIYKECANFVFSMYKERHNIFSNINV